MIPDLSQTAVVVVVFGMHGCGACDEYIPRLASAVEAARKNGAPFFVWSPGQAVARGQIPVLFYDAASEEPQLSAFADKLGVSVTPSTYIMTRTGSTKIEGAVDDGTIQRALGWAQHVNR